SIDCRRSAGPLRPQTGRGHAAVESHEGQHGPYASVVDPLGAPLPAAKGAPNTKRVRVKSCYEMSFVAGPCETLTWLSETGLPNPLWALGFSTPTSRMRTFACNSAPIFPGSAPAS